MDETTEEHDTPVDNLEVEIDEEIRRFLRMKRIDPNANVLLWWATDGKKLFPLLRKTAMKHLITPATSTASGKYYDSSFLL